MEGGSAPTRNGLMGTEDTRCGRTRVKICGITRPEDGAAAARLGVDAIGLVFYEPSPRCVDIDRARQVAGALPPFVTTVALFVDAEEARVRAVLEAVQPGLLQFHGDESAEYCAQFGRPYVKAVRMRPGVNLAEEAARYASASGLLLDAYEPGVPGGTGNAFEWARVPPGLALPVILAGGLKPENVGTAIRTVMPFAVDVSGGVEREKGVKDHRRMSEFMQEVNSAGTG